MSITTNNNIVKQQQFVDQKNQSYIEAIQQHSPVSIQKVHPVSQSDIKHNDNFKKDYDIERYVRMLKNMVIPPETRKDIAVLVELELKSNVGISITDLQMLLSQVEREERMKKEHKDKE